MTDQMIYRGFVPELEIRAASKGGDGRTVEGIAVPYGRAVRINPELTEQFARGAFNHQLAAFHRVKFSREHMGMGGTLIGRGIEARDDAAGLWAAFRVSATPAGDETLELLRDGALDELSIGFRETPRGQRTIAGGIVERTKVNMFETSVVMAGAYGQGARVKALRSSGLWAPAEHGDDLDDPLEAPPVQRSGELEYVPGSAERLRQLAASVPPIPLF